MTTDIKELVDRLRLATVVETFIGPDGQSDHTTELGMDAADALEAMAGEVERLTSDVDALGDNLERVVAESDRLKAALRLWQDAWATGRNEPMAIAANATKNELGGDAS